MRNDSKDVLRIAVAAARPADRAELRKLLESSGHIVTTISSRRPPGTRSKQDPPSVVIVDAPSGDRGTAALCRGLQRRSLPVILITDSRQAANGCPADVRLARPLDRESLLELVRLLTKSRQQAASAHQAETLVTRLLDHLPVAVYQCSPSGVVINFNRRAATLWGRSPVPGDNDELFCGAFRLHYPDGRPLPHNKSPMGRVLRTGRAVHNQPVIIERPDGSRVPIRANVVPLRDATRKITGAINCMLDVSERHAAESRLQMQYEIARILAEAVSRDAACEEILRVVCEQRQWDRGELWLPDESEKQLRCVDTWQRVKSDFPNFNAITSKARLARRQGLPGRAWATGRPVALPNIREVTSFPRLVSAAAEGLRGAFAFPIRSTGKTHAIMAFYSREVRKPNRPMIKKFESVGKLIGQFINRVDSEEDFRRQARLLELTDDAIFVHDAKNLRIRYWNGGAARCYGWSRAEAVGLRAPDLLRTHFPRPLDEFLAKLHRTGMWSGEMQQVRRDGTPIWVVSQWALQRDEVTGKPTVILETNHDITDRKRAEQLMRRIPRRVIRAQEAERRRVARELHDSVGQLLASARFRLQTITPGSSAPTPVPEALSAARTLVEQALLEVRRLSHNLLPSELDDFGLATVLRNLASEFRQGTGIKLTLSTSRADRRMDRETELALYRIAQEALSNAARHASSREISMRLSRLSDSVLLRIRDDGKGFDPVTVRRPNRAGLGLVNMRERALSLGGSLTVTSAPGSGTQIEARLPVREKQ